MHNALHSGVRIWGLIQTDLNMMNNCYIYGAMGPACTAGLGALTGCQGVVLPMRLQDANAAEHRTICMHKSCSLTERHYKTRYRRAVVWSNGW